MKQKMCGTASLTPNHVGVMTPTDPPPILPVEESSAMSATTVESPQAEFLMRFFKIIRGDTKKVGQVLVLEC